jgi:hypothetical protein
MAKVFTKVVGHCSECPNYRKAPWGGQCQSLKVDIYFKADTEILADCPLEEDGVPEVQPETKVRSRVDWSKIPEVIQPEELEAYYRQACEDA